jgi:Na+/proline symporter
MNLTYLDWGIVIGVILVMFYAAQKTRKYNRSVADFLASNRCAGRYLLYLSTGNRTTYGIQFISLKNSHLWTLNCKLKFWLKML